MDAFCLSNAVKPQQVRKANFILRRKRVAFISLMYFIFFSLCLYLVFLNGFVSVCLSVSAEMNTTRENILSNTIPAHVPACSTYCWHLQQSFLSGSSHLFLAVKYKLSTGRVQNCGCFASPAGDFLRSWIRMVISVPQKKKCLTMKWLKCTENNTDHSTLFSKLGVTLAPWNKEIIHWA